MDWISTELSSNPQTHAKKKYKHPERKEQIALVTWLRLRRIDFTSIPNEGRRSRVLGAIMKALGLTAGVSDLFICEMRGGFGGFWVEMKAMGKVPTHEQYDWLFRMEKKGYKAAWFDDWVKAKRAIEDYLVL